MKRDELIQKMCKAWYHPNSAESGMAAALDVAIAELLHNPRDYEPVNPNTLFAKRRAHYSAKPKTLEERVTVVPITNRLRGDIYVVYLDDIQLYSLGNEHAAKVYRLGVIAEMRAEGK